jgi:hypothetical protein
MTSGDEVFRDGFNIPVGCRGELGRGPAQSCLYAGPYTSALCSLTLKHLQRYRISEDVNSSGFRDKAMSATAGS